MKAASIALLAGAAGVGILLPVGAMLVLTSGNGSIPPAGSGPADTGC